MTTSALRPALLVPALAGLLALASCGAMPRRYEPELLPSGLTLQELVIPEGLTATAGDRVTLHYHGTLEDGTVIDSTLERGLPVTFTLGAGQVPLVLEEGTAGMRLLGKRAITAPAELVFPGGAPPGVPPGSTLRFELELLAIEREDPEAAAVEPDPAGADGAEG